MLADLLIRSNVMQIPSEHRTAVFFRQHSRLLIVYRVGVGESVTAVTGARVGEAMPLWLVSASHN